MSDHLDSTLARLREKHAPVEPHPPLERIRHYTCPWAWEFRCEHRDKRGGKCPQTRAVRCNGGPHVPLEEAVAATVRFGWRLVTDSYPLGWRCLEHAPQEG